MPPKRKRANTQPSKLPTLEIAQPSSRDASDEDATDAVLQEVKQRQQESMNPPAKRTRSKVDMAVIDGVETSDPEQGKSSRSRASKKSTRSAKDDVDLASSDGDMGENGERGQLSMENPPEAGLVHPKGYRTNPPPTGRPVRVYADGVFDLFHLGHMRQLQQAKTAFPNVHLLVGVTGDKETHRRKGLTVLSGKERAESVRHCKWVDEVIEDCPWVITDAPGFLDKHRIDYVAHDDLPYGADEGDDIYAPIKSEGKFLVTQRTEGVSTTGIITKIVRDYDQYIARQLKRGTPRQDLNVSWLKKNELNIKKNIVELRDTIRNNWSSAGSEVGKDLRQFWQSSRSASPSRVRDMPEGELGASPRISGRNSPSLLGHLSHLDIPRPAWNGSPDFAAGYSLGLIGGVRSWMARSRRTLNETRLESSESDEDSNAEEASEGESRRGRKRNHEQDPEAMDTKS